MIDDDADDIDDIDNLIEQEFQQEKERKRLIMEQEEIEKNASLDLVNEFIQNEARSSFNKQKAAGAKKKRKEKKAVEKTEETIIKIEDDEPDETITPVVPKVSEKKAKKPKKRKIAKTGDSEEHENHLGDVDVAVVTVNKKSAKTKEKAVKKTKKKNKIVPKAKDSINNRNRDECNDDTKLDISFMTMILMGISLESEFPAVFYKKLFRKKKFKEAMQGLSGEQRKLVLAMMSDDAVPDIDHLPIKNHDNSHYKLQIPT